ncbi:hypothetical protein, partial [Pseudoalteromonas ruthenica]|uniref:hypothetical protein n=1 Tax=Pseudoalteromonas ruthenica TaxID=151081 RepID=UPI0004764637
LAEVLVCKQSAVSVDAHYREIRFPRNPFFKENCKKWIVCALYAQNALKKTINSLINGYYSVVN